MIVVHAVLHCNAESQSSEESTEDDDENRITGAIVKVTNVVYYYRTIA